MERHLERRPGSPRRHKPRSDAGPLEAARTPRHTPALESPGLQTNTGSDGQIRGLREGVWCPSCQAAKLAPAPPPTVTQIWPSQLSLQTPGAEEACPVLSPSLPSEAPPGPAQPSPGLSRVPQQPCHPCGGWGAGKQRCRELGTEARGWRSRDWGTAAQTAGQPRDGNTGRPRQMWQQRSPLSLSRPPLPEHGDTSPTFPLCHHLVTVQSLERSAVTPATQVLVARAWVAALTAPQGERASSEA